MVVVTYGGIRVDFVEQHAAPTKEIIFLLVIATLWCSGMAAVRGIVKEQALVRHEVRFGMGLLPYLLSKLMLLPELALAQAAVLLWVIRYLTELTGGFAIQFVVIAVTATVGLTLGLLVSAVSSERAMTVLPVVLIVRAIFSGGIAWLTGVVELLAQMAVPAYWALDGIRSTFTRTLVRATYPNAPGTFMPPILGGGGPVALDLLALLIHGTVFSVLAYLVLRFKFHGRMLAQ